MFFEIIKVDCVWVSTIIVYQLNIWQHIKAADGICGATTGWTTMSLHVNISKTVWYSLKLWRKLLSRRWVVNVLYLYLLCSDSGNCINSHFSLFVTKWWTLSTMPVLSVYINDCRCTRWYDKLIETAVEKFLFTDCQNLEAHSCSVFLGRQLPNINLSWGEHM